ncbi:MAG: M36 family metallopeptidase [Thermoleophilaceae bacterium]|nr:M36 family metallopeptidase [Thermoleophilaceae bacterium]
MALDDKTGRPRVLARRDGFLTRPSGRRPVAVALSFLRARAGTLGLEASDLASLELVRAYRSSSGAVHLQWEQSYLGIPLFGPGFSANVDADGRLINTGGGPRPDLAVASVQPSLSALDALLSAGRDAGVTVVPGRPGHTAGPERLTTFSRGHRASLTLFEGERVKLAWRVLLRGDSDEVYDVVVDAQTGETLYRASLVRHATARVFDNYPGAPVGGLQVDRALPGSWLSSTTSLLGSNAHVYSDPDDDIDGFPPDPSPVAADEIAPSAGNWNYTHVARPAGPGQTCPANPGCSWSNFDGTFSWTVNRSQAATQLFYFVNRFHDHLRDAVGIGFGDGSNNFEGADGVEAQVDDGAGTDGLRANNFPDCDHTSNAFVIPVPEGTSLVMQFYLWSNRCFSGLALNDVNPVDDALIVYHEYTHGMTNRLVTDAAGFPGLNGDQAGAMDEGFADWYALDLLNGEGFEPDTAAPGELVAGRYENDRLRTQAFDCPVGAPASACPGFGSAGSGGYTYGDFGKILGEPEVHVDGEIWVETLWDLRTRLIADHGAGDGTARARALVTDALRLGPVNPTFLDLRNAILQADLTRSFGDRDRIWAVFAARGMGFRASTAGSADVMPVEDFSLPPAAEQPEQPAPPPTADTSAPSISRVSMTRRRFKVGRARTSPSASTPSGTAFTFRLSERATVRIAIERGSAGRVVRGRCLPAKRSLRRRPRCTRYARVATLVRAYLPAGARQVAFSGRIGRRALRPGAYRATISATDPAGNRSRVVRLTFSIVRR